MKKSSIIACLAACCFSCQAAAADLPVKSAPPVVYSPVVSYSWTGFYAGVNGGVGWQTDDMTVGGANQVGVLVVNSGFVPSSIATRGDGGMFGATVGYNWQFNDRFVVGAEGDIDWANIKGSGAQSVGLGPVRISAAGDQSLRWIGTLRARAGYLLTPTTLVYGTGGLAFGGVESNASVTLSAPGPFSAAAASSVSSTKTGWTLGAGIEQQFLNRWSLKAEYRYVDLGSLDGAASATVLRTPVAFNTSQSYTYQMALVGLNYRFTGQ